MEKDNKMKKTINIIFAVTALFVFIGASVWEGTASASMGEDFPETGYYAATNSYPVNTVVDITNLENNRTVRVIVMSNLENPGLLAVLSRDAADAIGINPRSIGRVRMNQPSDSIAYSRFIGGYGVGDPDHDPLAMISSTEPNPGLFTDEAWSALNEEIRSPAVVIAESPEAVSDGEAAKTDAELSIPKTVEEVIVQAEPVEVPPPDYTSADPLAHSPHSFYDRLEEYEFVITPDHERLPPDFIYYFIDPADIVDTWHQSEPAPAAPAAPLEMPPAPLSQFLYTPSEPAPAYSTPAPAASSPAFPVTEFSVPMIYSLERGMYYIQIGAYARIDTVESELLRHIDSYPMVVQDAGTPGNPLYRVLVGPLNLGESGALLHRFRGIYSDAFVRQGL